MVTPKATTSRLPSASAGPVESEATGKTAKGPSNKAPLAWVRWRISKERDFKFKNEMNIPQELTSDRNNRLCQFLPMFHCGLNWAENFRGKSKPHARKLTDWLGLDGDVPSDVAFSWTGKDFRRALDAICQENTGDCHCVPSPPTASMGPLRRAFRKFSA